MTRDRRATTLVEVLVATGILLLIAGAVAGYVHRLGRSLARGEEDGVAAKEVSYLLRFLTLRLGSLNPPLTVDKDGDLWVAGEEKGFRPLTRVWIVDRDGRAENGGEELEYGVTGLEPEFRVTPGRLYRDGAKLVEQVGDQRSTISERVTAVHFRRGKKDPRLLFIDVELELPATSEHPTPLHVARQVALRPDADRVVFQVRGEEL